MPVPYSVHPDGRRLGKKPVSYDSRHLRLSRYLTDKLLPPPPAIDHASRVSLWPMYLNDQLGICGPAGAAHQIQSWSTYAGSPVLPDAEVVKADYFAITGGKDAGVDLNEMARYWRNHGIGGDKIEAYVAVNPNITEMELTIQHFGSIGIGLSLPNEGTFGPWDRVYGPPNPYNGHYVTGVRYDHAGGWIEVVTWGGVYRMIFDFFLKYCDQAIAFLNDLSLIQATMTTPEGFNFTQLQEDLSHIGDPSTPTPGGQGCNPLGWFRR